MVRYSLITSVSNAREREYIPQDLDDPSVSPPHSIIDHAQLLREIMQVYDSSLLSEGSSDSSEASTGFQRILDIMVDPAVTTCAAAAEEKGRLRPRWDRAVFVLNCLGYLDVRDVHVSFLMYSCPFVGVKNVLEPFAFTEEKRKEVRDNIEERVRLLEDDHVSFVSLLRSGGLRLSSETQYESLLKDASLSDAIRTLETKDPAVSPLLCHPPLDMMLIPGLPLR